MSKKPWVFMKGKLAGWQQVDTLWAARDPSLMTAFGEFERVLAANPTMPLTLAYDFAAAVFAVKMINGEVEPASGLTPIPWTDVESKQSSVFAIEEQMTSTVYAEEKRRRT